MMLGARSARDAESLRALRELPVRRMLAPFPPRSWDDWSDIECSIEGCHNMPAMHAPVLVQGDPDRFVCKAWICDEHYGFDGLFALSGWIDKLVAMPV